MGENKDKEKKHSKDLVFIYPNDIRGRGFMLHYVLGVESISAEPASPNGLQVVHTINGDIKIGTGYIRIAEV